MKEVKRLVALSLVVSLLTGCVSTSQNYAMSRDTGTYFTAPHGWKKVSQVELSKVEAASTSATVKAKLELTRWSEAYVADPKFGPQDVLSSRVPSSPIAFAQVRYLNGDEINQASYNFLRNLVYPITSWAEGSLEAPSDLNILDDGEVVQKGASGVHTRISFTGQDRVAQVFDQTSLLSNDRRTIYVFIVRAALKDFDKQSSQLMKIVSSFTVRGDA